VPAFFITEFSFHKIVIKKINTEIRAQAALIYKSELLISDRKIKGNTTITKPQRAQSLLNSKKMEKIIQKQQVKPKSVYDHSGGEL